MVLLAIRDDDLNFFSKAEEIEKVYEKIPNFPVTFAIIPTVMDVSTKGACPDTRGNTTPRWIGENPELVAWIRNKLSQGLMDVCMHGLSHEYQHMGGKDMLKWNGEKKIIWRRK